MLFFAAVALLLTAALPVHGETFAHIVTFGDSLSDNGNLYNLTLGLVPDSDYFEGRFSNGPVWVERLAAIIGADLDDLAYGGASTDGFFPPGLGAQIATWQAQGDSLQGLFTVWAGANDYLLLGRTDAQRAVLNIMAGFETLASDGVSRILILNLPDLGLTPRFLSESAGKQAEASAYSMDFNQKIADSLVSFSGNHPGVLIYFLNAYDLFERLVSDPAEFGFQNASKSSPDFGMDYRNDGGYVFWDDVHPTTEAHALLAQEASALLSEDCTKVNEDLSINLFFVDYAGMRFAFTLNYIGAPPGYPEGFYWQMDLATLGVAPDNILGIAHVVADDDLDLIVPCAEYGGNRYAFRLDFVGSGGPGIFLWRLEVPSLMMK
jgi:phospholipase/lecithinase/hemolysin